MMSESSFSQFLKIFTDLTEEHSTDKLQSRYIWCSTKGESEDHRAPVRVM